MIQSRQRAVISLLNRHGFTHLTDHQVLEVGCGSGGVLLEYLSYGATPERLHGTDLIFGRVRGAQERLCCSLLTCADGQNLPYPGDTFDLVLQYTVFSSILDDLVKTNLAQEMLRVLHKAGGIIVWYDFWTNPINPQTRGVRKAEIRRLFPGCQFEFRRITLAPPLARLLAPFWWALAGILETLQLFNTHYLVAISPIDKQRQYA
jgi:ubiquinone/menaquinone biosynthesis C-methylase UbiE